MRKWISFSALLALLVGAVVLLRLHSRPPVGKSLSIFIDGYTNYRGARLAGAVLTNQGPSAVRVWAWASFEGPLPATFNSKHEPSEHARLLPSGSSLRVLIPAPTNGTPWCAEFEVSPDSWYIRLIQGWRSSRYEWIKSLTGISEPEVSVEVIHTASRTD